MIIFIRPSPNFNKYYYLLPPQYNFRRDEATHLCHYVTNILPVAESSTTLSVMIVTEFFIVFIICIYKTT